MSRRINFTKRALEALPEPDRAQKIYDTKIPGLYIHLFPSGTRTFYLYRKVRGEPVRVKLGRFPEISVDDARKQAQEKNVLVNKGINPNADKRAFREEITLGEAFNSYITKHCDVHNKKRTAYDYHRLFKGYLQPLANKRLSSVSTSTVERLHVSVRNKGGKKSEGDRKTDRPYAANRTVALLSAIFNFAIRQGWKGENPTRGIKKFPEKKRTRFLERDEIGAFIEECYAERNRIEGNPVVADFLLTCLFTGIRRRNVEEMEWKHVNLARRTWDIPDTKNNLPQRVFLAEPLTELLKARRRSSFSSRYVFSGEGREGHIHEPRFVFRQILKRAGVKEPITIHGLRHTFATYAIEPTFRSKKCAKLVEESC